MYKRQVVPWTRLDYAILSVKFCLWLCFLALFLHLEIAAVFVCTTGFVLIYLNLGTRHKSQPSAYSVFNPNCEAIDGTLTGEQFDREIRRGMQ